MVPYNNVASDYLQTRYFDDAVDANAAMSIPDTLAMFLIPAMGYFVDKLGRKVSLMAMGSGCFIAGHLLLAVGRGKFSAISALIVLGFGYSTLLAFWACVPTLVRNVRHSAAYGVLTSACNLSVTLVSLIVAPLVAHDPTFHLCGLFFSLLATCSLVLVALLSGLNCNRRLGLDQSDSTLAAEDDTTSTLQVSITGASASQGIRHEHFH